jgi:hypothetical protein
MLEYLLIYCSFFIPKICFTILELDCLLLLTIEPLGIRLPHHFKFTCVDTLFILQALWKSAGKVM